MATKEEILQRKNDADTSISTCIINGYIEPVYEAMEEYAKQECIKFALYLIGTLPFHNDKTFCKMGFIEEQLMNIPSTIGKRYELYYFKK